MIALSELIDDSTRSKLDNLNRKLGGGKLTLYVITDKHASFCLLVTSTCSEEALKLCREKMGEEWSLKNSSVRAVQRNVVGEPEVVTGFEIDRDPLPEEPRIKNSGKRGRRYTRGSIKL